MTYTIAALLLISGLTGCWKLFEKAGRKGWEALIPVYNFYVMLRLSARPVWWLIWLFIPGLNVIAAIIIYVDFIKSYGKFSAANQAAALFLGFIYLPKWGFDKTTRYLAPYGTNEFREKYQSHIKRSPVREWGEAILFAAIAATLIRTFFIEGYVIPSGSMESSLLTGDYIFVSKIHYGARTPITPVSFPFAHNTLPKFNVVSYWRGLQLPYFRLPGLTTVKRGDVVVFNYPMDADSPLYRPVDKRENFIKRCQGIPGDTIAMIGAQVYVNGHMAANPPMGQQSYIVRTNGNDIKLDLINELHIEGGRPLNNNRYEMLMTRASAERLKSTPNIISVEEQIEPRGVADPGDQVFPLKHPSRALLGTTLFHYKWNVDNFGPLIIPKRGLTVKLDSLTLPIYERAIEVYEHNKVQVIGKDLLINDKKATSYTFKLDYYWMMGDNRHNSEDSRYWGFVPEDHIEGKAVCVWMSTDSTASFMRQTRWSRIFKIIH